MSDQIGKGLMQRSTTLRLRGGFVNFARRGAPRAGRPDVTAASLFDPAPANMRNSPMTRR